MTYAHVRPLTDVEKKHAQEMREYAAYVKRQKINKILGIASVTAIITVFGAIAWKLDPINMALAKQGIVLTED